jgi:hypothetical protein
MAASSAPTTRRSFPVGALDCEYALGDTPEQRFMGYWSDGVPVAELEVVADPGPPDPVTPTPSS